MSGRTLLAGVAAAALVTAAASAQSSRRPAFEAATIKLAAPTTAPPVPIAPTAPNRLRIPNRTLAQMIYMAYGGAGFNTAMSVRGGPDWVRTTTFYVEGVASARATAADLRIDGATMSTVAEMLSLPTGRQVLGTITQDRTGLTGRYTLDLDYLFGATDAQLAESPNPSLTTAIREQWGMRLVPGKGQLKVLVVESAQLPTTN